MSIIGLVFIFLSISFIFIIRLFKYFTILGYAIFMFFSISICISGFFELKLLYFYLIALVPTISFLFISILKFDHFMLMCTNSIGTIIWMSLIFQFSSRFQQPMTLIK